MFRVCAILASAVAIALSAQATAQADLPTASGVVTSLSVPALASYNGSQCEFYQGTLTTSSGTALPFFLESGLVGDASTGWMPTDPNFSKFVTVMTQSRVQGHSAVATISYVSSEIDCGYQLTNVVKSASIVLEKPPKVAAPNTVLKRAVIDARHRAATFTFAAKGQVSGYQCALVPLSSGGSTGAPHFRSCGSLKRPVKRYVHLARRHYRFYVRAVGPGGTDNTPASHGFAIP